MEFRHQGEDKKQYVQEMFDDISPKYDFLNHFLSFGLDYYWRWKLVRALELTDGDRVLDVATGTGDVGFSILKHHQVTVTGLDYSLNMVKTSRKKASRKKIQGFYVVQGDGEKLPFPDYSFNAITIAYGFRNIGHYEEALLEFQRVLKPGGQLMILEFSVPQNPFFRGLYNFYFHHVLPRIAALFSRSDAYRYLPESVDNFPTRTELMNMMEKSGFGSVKYQDITFGVTSIFMGKKLQ